MKKSDVFVLVILAAIVMAAIMAFASIFPTDVKGPEYLVTYLDGTTQILDGFAYCEMSVQTIKCRKVSENYGYFVSGVKSLEALREGE